MPLYRFPQPFPVPAQGWAPAVILDSPEVSVRIGARRYHLRLRGGPRYRRQLQSFRAMCSGDAKYGELALYRQGSELLCKMVAYLPRAKSSERTGVLYARSTAEALIVAANQKDHVLWAYHADQIPRWIAEHGKQLQHWSDDTKAEQRPVPSFAERRKLAADRYHNRMRSAVQEAARYLLNYAERRKFQTVEWNDRERSFAPDFPWAALSVRMAQLADELGMEFRGASSKVTEKTA